MKALAFVPCPHPQPCPSRELPGWLDILGPSERGQHELWSKKVQTGSSSNVNSSKEAVQQDGLKWRQWTRKKPDSSQTHHTSQRMTSDTQRSKNPGLSYWADAWMSHSQIETRGHASGILHGVAGLKGSARGFSLYLISLVAPV